ncbi:UPF0763 protein [Campylobacter ureolyticus]|uniref:DUF2603 domain-containing protein n=1 Tax=Campylobacter ureolyticus TaxID=827 RepID=UPI001FC8325D|nr:DUF2603 domain-containing protein [Campylobacter ureolyticus]GKH61036.1 UPF0763 protein [Campylobacter ureolyticus]
MDKEIEKIEQDFGKDQTIFEILNTEDSDKKTIMLKKGSWRNRYPWFGIDEEKNIYSVLSLKSLTSLINSYKNVARENFDLKLEKSIARTLPIDFGDVWSVCMEEIKKLALLDPELQVSNLDLDKIVDNVKLKYPNLFVDIDNMIRGNVENFKHN